METEGRYTLVGTVVLAVLGALVAAIVWLAGGADHLAYNTYTVYFRQQSLDGLAVGSPVKMRGIKIGIVDGYRFVDQDGEAVSVTVRLDTGVPLREGAMAFIKRSLVTGIGSVEIRNGPAEAPPLARAPAGERYPVIAEGTSDIDKVTTAVSRLAENGAAVLDKMNLLLSEDNQRAISQTLTHLNELSGHLAANKTSLDNAVQGIRDAADEFRFAGDSISRAATRAEYSVVTVGDNANAALREATATLSGFKQEASLLSQRFQTLAEVSALEVSQVGRDVRVSADALTRTGQGLANPRSVIFGPQAAELGPGERLP